MRDTFVPGWYAAVRNVRANVRGNRMTLTGPTPSEIAGVVNALQDISVRARAIPARVLVMLIPSKPTAVTALTKEAQAYDAVIKALESDDTVDILDLRTPFREHADPASLYYRIDGHWNRAGMKFAGDRMLDYIEQTSGTS